MLRRTTNSVLIFVLLAAVFAFARPVAALAQDTPADKPATTPKAAPDKSSAAPKQVTPKANPKDVTAEQVAENTIFIYGTRPGLAQVRRNGWERGKTTSIADDGRTEDGTYERRFIRGESTDKDKVRLDQKTPTLEYSLVYGDGKTWGFINGSAFTPRLEATNGFLSQMWHGIDALLRYKENGSTLSLNGKDKQQNIDLYVIELTDKEKRRTRYYISQKYWRVLSLEYEELAADGSQPQKYMQKFYDYQYVQGTLVPRRTVMTVNGKQRQETSLKTVTYGIKMDDTLFKNPEAQTSAATP
ncbi:MAG: hypothetical protein QOJ64_3076 [Acidobacteriota bacterium]|nr:hypothetical protein [Acidobacteriota bacterium]